MPYIERRDRELLYAGTQPDTAGQLNFLITTLLDTWLYEKGLNYGNLNTAIGVLEAVKLELYRRLAVPYEDWKLVANGDVYSKKNLTTNQKGMN